MIFGKKDKKASENPAVAQAKPEHSAEQYKMPWDETEAQTGQVKSAEAAGVVEEASGVQEASLPAETAEAVAPQDSTAQDSTEDVKPSPLSMAEPVSNEAASNTPGPDMPARPASLPPLSFVPAGAPTILSRVYSVLALSPLLTLSLLLIAQTVFTLDARGLWYSDEIRHGNVLQNLLQHGDWLILQLNGLPYPDKPPLYFWFLAGIQYVLGYLGFDLAPAAPMVMQTGAALSGLFLLWACLAMAKYVAGVDRRGRLASGLVLLSCLFFVGLLHYARMDLFFSALIVVSCTLIFKALQRESSLPLMLVGFFAAGLAVLTKGPLGLAFPLLASLLFIVWTGKFRRLFRMDFGLGLVVGLLPGLLWLGIIWLTGNADFVSEVLNGQIVERALDANHHQQPWHHYLVSLPLVWLPWTLLVFFLPWGSLFSKNTLNLLRDSRKGERQGLAFLWLLFLGGVLLLSLISTKIPIYLLPLFAPLAILTGRAALGFSERRCLWFQRASGLFMILLAVNLLVAALFYSGKLDFVVETVSAFGIPAWLLDMQGVFILAGILLVGGCVVMALVNAVRPEGVLLALAALCAAFIYPMTAITAPSLDAVLSPRAQAALMQEYMDKGYYSMTFAMYPGTYSYYTKSPQEDLPKDWERLQRTVQEHSAVVLAMSANKWAEWHNMQPQGAASASFHEVSRQWIAESEYVLLVKDPLPPAPAPVEPAQPQNAPAIEPATPEEPANSGAVQGAVSGNAVQTGVTDQDIIEGDQRHREGRGAGGADSLTDPAGAAVPGNDAGAPSNGQ